MAHGLPVIATTAGAIPETVPRQAGLLVSPGDPAALARALRVLAQPAAAKRLAAGSRAAGVRLPDWAQATQTMGNGVRSPYGAPSADMMPAPPHAVPFHVGIDCEKPERARL